MEAVEVVVLSELEAVVEVEVRWELLFVNGDGTLMVQLEAAVVVGALVVRRERTDQAVAWARFDVTTTPVTVPVHLLPRIRA